MEDPHQVESASDRKWWSIYNRGTTAWDKACVSRSSSGPCAVMSCVPHPSCATPLGAETGVADGSLSLARSSRRGSLGRNKPASLLWRTGIAPDTLRACPFQPHLVACPISNVISSTDRNAPASLNGQRSLWTWRAGCEYVQA